MADKNEQLKKAFDSSTMAGKLVNLNTEQATEFIDYIVDESSLLKQVRLIRMTKPNKTIAKIMSAGRFLRPGKTNVKLTEAEMQEFQSDTLELSSKMVRGGLFLTDEEMADNIEGQAVTDHMIRLIARKVANELEEIAIYSKLTALGTPKTTLQQFK